MTLNAKRVVIGKLMGFDPFMNIVLDECENKLSSTPLGRVVIRGQSIVEIEALETIVAPREVITMG